MSSGGRTIARGRYQPPQRPVGKQLRINDFIRTSTVRLVDDNDQQVGVVELNEAKRRAREVGLDLVEVAPQATPPVCRIMDYGKWKYQQKKKEQKTRSHSKTSELKEIRLRPGIDEHDLHVKLERAREFLGEGDKVQFTLIFRGREMAHREIGLDTLRRVRNDLVMISKVEAEPRMMGRRMTMVLTPDRKSAKAAMGAGAGAPPAGQPAPPRPAVATAVAPAAAPPPPAAPAAPAPASPSPPAPVPAQR